MDFDLIIEILSSWKVILILLVVLVIFPLMFYLASFDKSPIRIKREKKKKKVKKKKAKKTDEVEIREED